MIWRVEQACVVRYTYPAIYQANALNMLFLFRFLALLAGGAQQLSFRNPTASRTCTDDQYHSDIREAMGCESVF